MSAKTGAAQAKRGTAAPGCPRSAATQPIRIVSMQTSQEFNKLELLRIEVPNQNRAKTRRASSPGQPRAAVSTLQGLTSCPHQRNILDHETDPQSWTPPLPGDGFPVRRSRTNSRS